MQGKKVATLQKNTYALGRCKYMHMKFYKNNENILWETRFDYEETGQSFEDQSNLFYLL